MKFIKALGRIIKKIVKCTKGIARKVIVFAGRIILATLIKLVSIKNIEYHTIKAFMLGSGVYVIYNTISGAVIFSIADVILIGAVAAMVIAGIAYISYVSNKDEERERKAEERHKEKLAEIEAKKRFYEERKAKIEAGSNATISEA